MVKSSKAPHAAWVGISNLFALFSAYNKIQRARFKDFGRIATSGTSVQEAQARRKASRVGAASEYGAHLKAGDVTQKVGGSRKKPKNKHPSTRIPGLGVSRKTRKRGIEPVWMIDRVVAS